MLSRRRFFARIGAVAAIAPIAALAKTAPEATPQPWGSILDERGFNLWCASASSCVDGSYSIETSDDDNDDDWDYGDDDR